MPTEQQVSDYKALHSAEKPDIPTLMFVSNDEDTFGAMLGENGLAKWKEIHRNYISGLTNGKLTELDCGHYVHVEKPDEISREIKDFINGLG